jgi:hypothetical protein
MILVVSSEQDGHATEVLSRLKSRGAEARLLDLSGYPRQSRLSLEFDSSGRRERRMAGAGPALDFSECHVVWWRRPQPFQLHDELRSDVDRTFAFTECHAAVSGMWLTLEPFWINHPTRDEEAARKVYQLRVAQDRGLSIPDTCITNDPGQARSFAARHGTDQVIYKAFSGTEQAWRETRLLKQEELGFLDKVKFAPVIFQEYIPADRDLRITVIDDLVFACAIDTGHTSYRYDFRMVMEAAEMAAFELPEELKARLVDYVRHLGLIYGAIDMRLTPAGAYVFLEINPSGQWLFVEQRTGLPITEALVDLMLRKDRKVEGTAGLLAGVPLGPGS